MQVKFYCSNEQKDKWITQENDDGASMIICFSHMFATTCSHCEKKNASVNHFANIY